MLKASFWRERGDLGWIGRGGKIKNNNINLANNFCNIVGPSTETQQENFVNKLWRIKV